MNVQSTEAPRLDARKKIPYRARSTYARTGAVAAYLCFTCLFFISLVALWLGQTSGKVYRDGAEALTIRAVLRTDTDDVAAELLAADIRNKVPDVSIEVINEAMGRSLLPLQEPWIAEMPDFAVTPLPKLLEITHPQLLTNPVAVTQFVKELGENPAVDFVAYNETAHDRLTKFATASGQIEKHALQWLLSALTIVAFAATFACAVLAGNLSPIRTLIYIAGVWLPACATGWMIYRQWESIAISSGDWQRLPMTTHLTLGGIALAILIAARALTFTTSRFRQ